MWGRPRAEILAINAIHIPITTVLGLIAIFLAIYTQVTGNIESVLWVPFIAGAMTGMAMTADALIHRQYAVLQAMGDISAPNVTFWNQFPVGFGHATALIPVLIAVVYAELKAWNYFQGQPMQKIYLWGTVVYLLLCASGWIIAAVLKPTFTK